MKLLNQLILCVGLILFLSCNAVAQEGQDPESETTGFEVETIERIPLSDLFPDWIDVDFDDAGDPDFDMPTLPGLIFIFPFIWP